MKYHKPWKGHWDTKRTVTGIGRYLPIAAPLWLAAFGIVAMVCLLAGQFHTWLVWPLGTIAASWAVGRMYRKTREVERAGSSKERALVDVIVVCGVLLWTLTNLPFTAQHLFTNRDPATYNLAAGWLINHNDLKIPVPSSASQLNMPGLESESLGFSINQTEPKVINAQGAHMLPALLALGGRIVGFGNMLRLNVLFGATALLAMYGYGRLIMKPRWAALGTLAVSLSLPFIYFSRDAYTEPLTMAFLFAGLSLIYYSENLKRKSLWFLAGVVSGAAALTRIDSFLILAALELFAVIRLLYARPGEHRWLLRRVLLFALGAGIAGMIAVYDLAHLSNGYYTALYPEISQEFSLIYLLVAILVLGLALARFADLLALSQKLTKKWLARALTWLLPLSFAVLLSRPLWFIGHETHPDGVVARSFSEQTLNWIWWYTGPLLLVVGVAGFTWVWTGLVRLKRTLYLPFMLVLTMVSTLYLLKPSITGDQVWASRRLLPIVRPGFCLLGMMIFEHLYELKNWSFHSVKIDFRTPVTVIATLAVATPLVISYPFWIRRMYVPQLAQVQAVCSHVSSKDLVVWLGDSRHFAMQPTRVACGSDSIGLNDALTSDQRITADSLQQLASRSKQTIVIGVYEYQLELLPVEDRADMGLVSRIQYAEVEHSYKRAPRNAYLTDQAIYLGRLNKSGNVLPLNE